MAKPSFARSPEKRADNEDESESELEEQQERPGDGNVAHLGSDLPDTPDSSEDAQGFDEAAADANMGNATSKEEINAGLRATAEELHRRNGTTSTTSRVSTGKLKRPSASAFNPAYRKRTLVPATSRKLGPTNKARKSTYDIDESPEKLPPGTAAFTKAPADFSPLRKKPQQRSSPVRAEQRQQDIGAQRRSKRAQEARELNVREPTTTPRERATRLIAKQRELEAKSGTQDVLYQDHFPDPVVQRYHGADAAGGAAESADEDVDNDGIGAKPADADATEQDIAETVATAQTGEVRGRGRPRKIHEPVQASSEKRKRGRPKKSVAAGEEPTKPTSNDDGHGEHALQTQGEEDSIEPAAEPQLRQTRARTAASQSPQKAKPAEESLAIQLARERQARRQTDRNPDDDREFDGRSRHDATPEEGDNDNGKQDVRKRRKKGPQDKVAPPDRPAGEQPEEMYTQEDEEVSEDEVQETGSRKRKTHSTKSSSKANTGAKRRKFRPDENQDTEQAESSSSAVDRRRMYGQWPSLKKAFRKVEEVGCNIEYDVRQPQNEILLEDRDIKALVKLCKKATLCFTKLGDHSDDAETAEDPRDILEDISNRIDGLRGLNNEFPTDFTDNTKSTCIYFHLIPKLVKLVEHAIACYEVTDKDEVTRGQITITHLTTVTIMIEMILDLAYTSQTKYARPPTTEHVVQPVRSTVPLLREVKKAFNKRIANHERALLSTQQQEAEARDAALRLEQEERRSRQQAHINSLQNKWQKLHEERVWAEGGIMKLSKRQHLALPDHYFVETDQNGLPFERTELFHPRVGPPPGLVDRAAALQWSMVELGTLCDGLKRYAGANVFERTFRKYCGQRGELNRFSVAEIVVTAAGLREQLMELQGRDGGEVEEWVLGIPVWTKGHVGMGKENDDGDGNGDGVDLTAEG
ncbi:hypothetical protein LTR37_016650 [Vermiconidia calcicola]|uniref:Uncharacterized protein n=1 Tax=Vermiconidia calcicola TaxID=1690605 RepID=A0ACC3MMC3_9PEZI|nr:hypothetical protein LTR37_016650 [Vermiconidia calcicola]